jgi:hypothetical protein
LKLPLARQIGDLCGTGGRSPGQANREGTANVSKAPTSGSSIRSLFRALTPGRRFELIMVALLLVAGVGIGGHIYGRRLARGDIQERDTAIIELRADVQELDGQINEQNGKLAVLQTKLTSVQAALDTIIPSENTYTILPDQSLIVGDGHLTVGLVGPPTNDSINVNINGKQQSAAAGDIIRFSPDSSTNCRLEIQSFDMFKAVINASCENAKAQ